MESTGFLMYRALSFGVSREVTRLYSTSFYSATQLFSPPVREAIHGIYGFVRLADEIVDSFHGHDQRALLDRFEAEDSVSDENIAELQKELDDLNKEARKLKTRMKAIERRRDELMKELAG